MKLAHLAVAIGVVVPAGMATPVTYSTLGSELCLGASGCGTNSQTIGGFSVTFNPIAASLVDPGDTFTFGSFGQIVVSCIGNGLSCASTSLAGLNLYIHINQTSPTGDSGVLPAGMITGAISGTTSSAVITWPEPNALMLGSIQYSIANPSLALVPPSSNFGITTIQGRITETAVPEPSTFLLFSAGLIGIGLSRKVTGTRKGR